MDLMKITDVSVMMNLSSRTLRYYEEIGILKSIRQKDNNYRYYDDDSLKRIKQIMILRNMQIPISDIIEIFRSESTAVLLQKFIDKLESIDKEVENLSQLRIVVNEFLQNIKDKGINSISDILTLEEKVNEFITEINKDFALPPITIEKSNDSSKYYAMISVSNERMDRAKEKLLLYFEHSSDYILDDEDEKIICSDSKEAGNIDIRIPVTKTVHNDDCGVNKITLISPDSLAFDNGAFAAINTDNAAIYNNACNASGNYTLPVKIDFTAKTDNTNIRLWYGNALLILNWEGNKTTLHMREPLTSNLLYYDNAGYVTESEFHKITWVIDKQYMSVIVDGEVRLCTCDLFHVEYFRENPKFLYRDRFRFDTGAGSQVAVKDICITEYRDESRKPDKDLSEELKTLEKKALFREQMLSCTRELFGTADTIETEPIDLATLKHTHGPAMPMIDGKYTFRPFPSLPLTNGELVFKEGTGEPFIYEKHFEPPVKIELLAKIKRNSPEGNIMLTYGNTRFITIHFVSCIAKINCSDPVTSMKYEAVNTFIEEDAYHTFSFLIDKRYVAVSIDGNAVMTQSGMDYMLMYEEAGDFSLNMPFGIDTGWGVDVNVKSFEISKLKPCNEMPEHIESIMKSAILDMKAKQAENTRRLEELAKRYNVKKEHEINIREINSKPLLSDDKIWRAYMCDGTGTGYLYGSGNKHWVETKEKFSDSIEIDIEIEVPANISTILAYKGASVLLNGFFWNRSDMWLSDPKGKWTSLANAGRLKGGFNQIKWMVHRDFSALIINGELQYCFDNYRFPPYDEAAPIRIYTGEERTIYDYNFIKFRNLIIKELE